MRIPWLIVFILPLTVAAQEKSPDTVTDASNPFFIKTSVVVSATKSEIDVDKAPASTSIVTKEELQMRGSQFVDQSLNLLEGVQVFFGKGAADTLAGVGMRGFSGRGTGQSRVLVLLDGEPLNDGYTGVLTWQTLPVSEVERVEVVRGPFSSLYGGNAMGGVINILTRPVERRHMEFSGRYGSQNATMYSVKGSDLFWNRLGLTLGYQRLQTGGYPSRIVTATATASSSGTPVTGPIATMTTTGARTFKIGDGGDNWWNQDSWRARGEYTFSPKTTMFFQFLRQRYGYGYDAYNSYLRNSAGNVVDSGPVTFDDGGVARRISVTPGTFLSGPGGGTGNLYNGRLIHSLTSRQRLQFSGGVSDQPVSWYSTPAGTAVLGSGSGTLSQRPTRSYHGDAQWAWEMSGRHRFVAGAETRRESVQVSEFLLSNYAATSTVQSQSYASQGRALTQAVYAQDQIKVTERLQLIGGGRIDYWKTTAGSNNTFGTTLVNTYPDRSRTSANAKLSAVYQLAGGTTVRASVGTAFRNPTLYNLYRTWQSSSGTVYRSNPDLEPENLMSWEAGVVQRFGGRFQVSGSYFDNSVRNLIYLMVDLVADPAGKTQIYRNAGKARMRGTEISAKQKILSWLQLQEAYSYTHALITENTAVPASVGKRVTNVPWHQASGMLLVSRGRFTGTFSGRYVSRAYGTDTNTDVTTGVPSGFDPFFEAAASVGVQVTKQLEIQGGGENLLNRRYYQSYIVPGRTVYLGLRIGL